MPSKFWQHFISDGATHGADSTNEPNEPEESEAIDAFSQVVTRVAERMRPAVVNLRVGAGLRGGSGSGILFTPDGFLLTNNHVVGEEEEVRIRTNDGREIRGEVVGNDPWTDLAVVRADERN